MGPSGRAQRPRSSCLGRAGDWVFSETWLAEYRAELEQGIDAADPLDPGVPPPSEPWAADVIPLLGLERRGAKLYRPGLRYEPLSLTDPRPFLHELSQYVRDLFRRRTATRG